MTTLSVASYARLARRAGRRPAHARRRARRLRSRRLRDAACSRGSRLPSSGVVQGLTEFLPISSQRAPAGRRPSWPAGRTPAPRSPPSPSSAPSPPCSSTSATTSCASSRPGRRSLWRPELRGEPDARMGWYVIVGTLPIGILGFLLRDSIEGPARNLWLIATMLVVFGVALGVVDAMARNEKPLERLTMRDALIYGGAQALALVPGVSRSGGTTGAGLLMGYRREAAARYSFLLAIPAVLVSGVFELRKIGEGEPVDWGPTLLATGIAFVVGLRGHRLLPALHLDAQLPAVRDLPDRARPGGPRAARRRRHRRLTDLAAAHPTGIAEPSRDAGVLRPCSEGKGRRHDGHRRPRLPRAGPPVGTPRRRAARPGLRLHRRDVLRPLLAVERAPGSVRLRLVLARGGAGRRPGCRSGWSTRRAALPPGDDRAGGRRRWRRCSPAGSGSRSGTGEASNEHITGDGWPRKDGPQRPAAGVRRRDAGAARRGGGQPRRPGHASTGPGSGPCPPSRRLLIGTAVSIETARWVAGWADGLITIAQPAEHLRRMVDAYRAAGGRGPTRRAGPPLLRRRRGHRAPRSPTSSGAPTSSRRRCAGTSSSVEHFDEVGQARAARGHARRRCRSPADLGRHAAWLNDLVEIGFDEVYLHHVGQEQQRVHRRLRSSRSCRSSDVTEKPPR